MNCSSSDFQKFTLASTGYSDRIFNKGTQQCLDVRDASLNDNANVLVWGCNGQANRSWLTRDLYGVGQAPGTGHWAYNLPGGPDRPCVPPSSVVRARR
jgi:hypothetical protein